MNSKEVPQEGLLSSVKMNSLEIDFGEDQEAEQTGKSMSVSYSPVYGQFNLDTPRVAAVREKRVLGPSKLATFSLEFGKSEEAKLSAKYPNARQGVSSFLQKRDARGQKFDSGEYQVAKQTGKSISSLLPFYPPFNLETPRVAAVREKRVLGPSKLATLSLEIEKSEGAELSDEFFDSDLIQEAKQTGNTISSPFPYPLYPPFTLDTRRVVAVREKRVLGRSKLATLSLEIEKNEEAKLSAKFPNARQGVSSWNSEEVPQEGLLSAEKMDSLEMETSEEAELSAEFFDSDLIQEAKQTGNTISSPFPYPFYPPFTLDTRRVVAVREKRVLGSSKLATYSQK